MERYFVEPYRFIPPFRGTLWCRLGKGLMARHLKRTLGVTRWHVAGLDLLRQSLDQKAGILLTPNHCRWADPPLMGMVSCQLRQFFYYVASYHLFRQSKVAGWVMNRMGGYSIWREGADRESLKATAGILADADRPVVLFPEGTWFRQNDRVGPLQDGLSLITRQAARQSTRPIVVHPVGIKYWLLSDAKPAMRQRLDKLERRVGWSPQSHLDLLPRIEKVGGALLTLKEVEFLGQAQSGDLDTRIGALNASQIERLELTHLGKSFPGWPLERIRRLRQHLTRQLHEKATDATHAWRIKKDLDELLLFENLNAQSVGYIREHPSPERLAETIQRIEETLSDQVETPLGPMGATVQIGPAIDVRAFGNERKGGEELVQQLRETMQGLIDQLLAQGPPRDWGCPAPLTTAAAGHTEHPQTPALVLDRG